MSNQKMFPVHKFNISFPMWIVDNLEHTTEEELGPKIYKFVKARMESEPETLLKYASFELDNESGIDEMEEEELEDKVRFSAEYTLFLKSMMDAGLMDSPKGEDDE